MKRAMLLMLVCLCSLAGTAGASLKESGPGVSLKDGNMAFALSLYERLRGRPGNVFVSPYSISTALAMTYGGARGNTEKQIAATFRFPKEQALVHAAFSALQSNLNAVEKKGAVQLNIANSLWPHKSYPFLGAYLDLLKRFYGVEVTPVDYAGAVEAARLLINSWVESKTRDRIQNLILEGTLGPMTRLVLVNAIYFKGNWARQFDPEKTADADFFVTPSKVSRVPLMTKKDDFLYGENSLLQVLELPYEGEDLSMVVLLPKEKNGLKGVESALSSANLKCWLALPRKGETVVFLPKFKLDCRFELAPTLAAMGMPDAFSGEKADFSGMDGGKSLFIANVIHKAFVEVNEEGTEAAAATAVVMRMTCIPAPPKVFRADHPFLFMILDRKNGTLLFMGRVSDPLS